MRNVDGAREKLVLLMRTPPSPGCQKNAISHMWGYIAGYSSVDPQKSTDSEVLDEIQEKSQQYNVHYLLHSTALGELKLW
ncbi:MAG: hypothetical protein ABIJ50_03755 [Pseudomonadota bacterium]